MCVCISQIKLIQTPSKFLTLVQFIRYSLENGIKKKYDKNSRVKLSHNRTNSYSQITWIERCVTQHGQVKVSNLNFVTKFFNQFYW